MKGANIGLLKSILVTEKSTILSEKYKCLAFITSCDMGKCEIKKIISSVFPKLQVKKVRSMNLVPKMKFFRGKRGVRVKRKKILVSFHGSHELQLVN